MRGDDEKTDRESDRSADLCRLSDISVSVYSGYSGAEILYGSLEGDCNLSKLLSGTGELDSGALFGQQFRFHIFHTAGTV